MGKNFFLDEVGSVRGFVSVALVPSEGSLKGEPEELVQLFHSSRLRQETIEKAGHRSPTWAVL